MLPTRRALLPLLLLPLRAQADARAGALDPAILMARLASVPERRATFREERNLAAVTAPLVSTGRLFYRRPDYLEKDTLWPIAEHFVIDGARLIITDPASNDPPHVVPLDAQPGLRTLIDATRAPLAGDLATLRRAFTVIATGSLGAWRLDLTPSDPAASKLVSAICLTGQDSWIAGIRTTQPGGDMTTLRIAPA